MRPDIQLWNPAQQRWCWYRDMPGIGYHIIDDAQAGCLKEAKIQVPVKHVEKLFFENRPDLTSGEIWCTKTGAKIRYLGGGWWHMYGYRSKGEDVKECLDILENLRKNNHLIMKEK